MKPRLLIAGAGQTGRELARRLVSGWRVVILDRDPAKLALLETEGVSQEVTTVVGDCTSTLSLKEAGIESAQALIATTGRDDVNLETCRLARKMFDVQQVLSMVRLRSHLGDFDREGITAVGRSFSVASQLESRLEQGKRTTADIGLGQGELYEVTILANTPVIGRTLASLHPQSWLVAAIYREGALVVPHGRTVIEQGDRVLLIGDPHILPSIADYFRSGASEFPLHYGAHVTYAEGVERSEQTLKEAIYLASNSRALGLEVLLSEAVVPPEVDEGLIEDREIRVHHYASGAGLPDSMEGIDTGVWVVTGPVPGIWDRLGLGHRTLMWWLDQIREPVLLARGTYPYKKILLAVSNGPGQGRANELALDVARNFGAEITAVSVFPPAFVTGEAHHAELKRSLAAAVNMGSLYRKSISAVTLEGNPVHQLLKLAADHDLLVFAHQRGRRFSATHPDVSRHLLTRCPCSALVLGHGLEDGLGG